MRPTVLDLFAGCGGFSLGFQQAGCDVISFVEWWEPAITTFLRNHPQAQLLGKDISQISDEQILGWAEKVDIIVGGPPCQGFSLAGKRNPKDNRNQLYKEFLRFVRIISPKVFVMENVPGLLSMKDYDKEKIINKILHEFIALDYFVCYKVLKASDYGVAQDRERLIIIGIKLDLYPEIISNKKNVIDVICDLPFEENSLNAHLVFNTSKEISERIKNLKQGERLSEKYSLSPQRLFADKPSKTIVTKPIFIHPLYNRFLTPRELARLQSFPDDFFFCGSKTSMVKQIGNAVPPLLAEAVAKKIVGGFSK